tara:strand:- start:635 stop:985 length:351 start_codon:yes stop_codon:yes gene_type:complete
MKAAESRVNAEKYDVIYIGFWENDGESFNIDAPTECVTLNLIDPESYAEHMAECGITCIIEPHDGSLDVQLERARTVNLILETLLMVFRRRRLGFMAHLIKPLAYFEALRSKLFLK